MMARVADGCSLPSVLSITSILISRFLIHLQEVGATENSRFQSLSLSIKFEDLTSKSEDGTLQNDQAQQTVADWPRDTCAVLQRDDSGVP